MRTEGADIEELERQRQGVTSDRDFVLRALGEFFAAIGENGGVMPTVDAVRIADQLLLDLRISVYSPEVREEDVEKPAWFLEWLNGTFAPDIQELASRVPALRHEVGESLSRVRAEMLVMNQAIEDRKLTKHAKEVRRERAASREHVCGRDCDF